jgi:hypothetical protein
VTNRWDPAVAWLIRSTVQAEGTRALVVIANDGPRSPESFGPSARPTSAGHRRSGLPKEPTGNASSSTSRLRALSANVM